MALPWVKYIEQMDSDKKLMSLYHRLRKEFQKAGFSEKDLEKPPFYNNAMLSLANAFQDERLKLINELRGYFGDVSNDDFNDYLVHKMTEIVAKTPLSLTNYRKPKK